MTDQLLAMPAALSARRVVAIGIGAAVVAVSAQVVVPLPFTPVPMTLQPLAVLIVGALLGPAGGAAALVTYLMAGALGLPVFAAGGAGAARLLGPTGGYLLAFPMAAAIAGWSAGAMTGRSSLGGVLCLLLGFATAIVVIHVAGVSQLAALGGDPTVAFRIGFVPFVAGDLAKIGIAAAIVLLSGRRLRAFI